MKIETKEVALKESKPFPKLMVSIKGTIVYFTKEGEGNEINKNNGHIEHHSIGWIMENFKDFDGTITLSND